MKNCIIDVNNDSCSAGQLALEIFCEKEQISQPDEVIVEGMGAQAILSILADMVRDGKDLDLLISSPLLAPGSEAADQGLETLWATRRGVLPVETYWQITGYVLGQALKTYPQARAIVSRWLVENNTSEWAAAVVSGFAADVDAADVIKRTMVTTDDVGNLEATFEPFANLLALQSGTLQ